MCCHQEVEEQVDAPFDIDLVGGGKALVELIVDGGDDGLQPGHAKLCAVVQRVQSVVPERLDHVPHVHQVH